MLHYKACADTPRKKAADIAMIVFGCVAAVYTTMQTVTVRFLFSLSLLSAHVDVFV
jgi:proton-coupled amino acid transporter